MTPRRFPAAPRAAPPAALRARVLAAVSGAGSPTRRDVRRKALGWAVPLAVLTVVSLLVEGVTPGDRSESLVVAAVLVPLVACVAALVASAQRRSMLGPSRVALVAAMLAVAAGTCALLALAAVGAGSASPPPVVSASLSADAACLGLALLQGALPLGALFALRGGAPLRPRALGAALGAAAGAFAAAAAGARCPHAELAHVLVAHLAPVAVLVAVGAAAGSRRGARDSALT